jgi:hypothetical protein
MNVDARATIGMGGDDHGNRQSLGWFVMHELVLRMGHSMGNEVADIRIGLCIYICLIWPGMVVHAYNPSIVGGRDGRVTV